MLRLFLFIFGALLITLIGLSVGINLIANKLVKNSSFAFYENTFSGVFHLLDETLDTKDSHSIEESKKHIRSLFKFPASLEKRNNITLPAHLMEELDAGKLVYTRLDDADYLFQKSKHNDEIWSIAAELNHYDKNVALAEGPINLILTHIKHLPKTEQDNFIYELAEKFAFPILIAELSDLDLSPTERAHLLNGKVVGRNPGKDGERYFKKIDSSGGILQIGPIPLPGIIGIVNPVFTALFFTLLAIGCLLWLRPLWHDLRQLILASNNIAAGELGARIKPKSISIIRPVVDGFNRMAEQTERTIESQQALTNAVSHELRTPLARLKFSLEMAKDTAIESDRQRHLDDISIDVSELNQLVEELLTFTRHDRKDNQFDVDLFPTVPMHDWLEEQTLRAKRGMHKNTELKSHIDISKTEVARFHSRLMSYAVSNGISNAVRFAKSEVSVSFRREGSDYLLSIDDDGPGIPEQQHNFVFDPFQRLDESRNRESGGFGLGLSIVKKVAEWHNGTATLSSSNLGGNQLTIRWPVMQVMDNRTIC